MLPFYPFEAPISLLKASQCVLLDIGIFAGISFLESVFAGYWEDVHILIDRTCADLCCCLSVSLKSLLKFGQYLLFLGRCYQSCAAAFAVGEPIL